MLQYAARSTAGTRKWCSGPCMFTTGFCIRVIAILIGSVSVVFVQYCSIASSAPSWWQRSQTKCPSTQTALAIWTLWQYAHSCCSGDSR